MSTIIRPTTVISVRGRDRKALMADESFVYVGRACAGWPQSIWGNPWKYPQNRDACDRFERALLYDPGAPWATLRARLRELRGKTLGCWCGSWRPGDPDIGCHAVVLAKAANELNETGRPRSTEGLES